MNDGPSDDGVAAAGTSPRPQLCLTVGVTGHRPARLGSENLELLQHLVGTLLSGLADAVQAVGQEHGEAFSDQPLCLRLVTGLAEGADTLVAKAAAERGWRIDACLPFPRGTYLEDFSEAEAKETFARLLDSATAVFELPGERANEDAAYEAAGRVMLEQADIVLALWDGEPARGRGGTAQIVAEAIGHQVPVIRLDTHAIEPPMLYWSGLNDLDFDRPTIDSVARAEAGTVLAGVAAALCAPPDNDVDRRMRARFLQERDHKRTPAWPYPLLLSAARVRRFRRADLRPPRPEQCALYLLQSFNPFGKAQGAYAGALKEKLVTRFGMADAAATYFAQIFRSGFIVNFGFAVLAVLLATGGLLFPSAKLFLIATELAIIILILVNTRVGSRTGWHERWMDYRHLAEQLRVLSVTGLLGDLYLRHGDAGESGSIPGWVRWLSRATARELGLPSVSADQRYLSRVRVVAQTMIQDQIEYHSRNAGAMRKLDHRLHKAGEYLFGGTIVACATWIALKLGGFDVSHGKGVNVTALVTAVTAVLPAMGAALYGIRMQGDFAGIADRSTVTVKRLQRLQRALEADGPDFDLLSARLRRLREIALTDVAHWRTTYQARPLTLPG
ncbi:MAG: hypothetical protein J7493_09075 [Porphyrobacter sp.]|nr:hypothetical protein [Porphyrobacter sp.]